MPFVLNSALCVFLQLACFFCWCLVLVFLSTLAMLLVALCTMRTYLCCLWLVWIQNVADVTDCLLSLRKKHKKRKKKWKNLFRATCSHFKNDGKTLHSDHFESALSHTHSHQQHKYINAVIVAIVIISIRVAQRFHACEQWFHSVRFSFLLFCSEIFFHIFLPGS